MEQWGRNGGFLCGYLVICLQSDFLHESTVHCVSWFSDVFPLNSACLLNCQLVSFHVFLLALLFSTYHFLCDGHPRNCGVSVRKGPAGDPRPIHSLHDSVICVDEGLRLRPRHLICGSDKDHDWGQNQWFIFLEIFAFNFTGNLPPNSNTLTIPWRQMPGLCRSLYTHDLMWGSANRAPTTDLTSVQIPHSCAPGIMSGSLYGCLFYTLDPSFQPLNHHPNQQTFLYTADDKFLYSCTENVKHCWLPVGILTCSVEWMAGGVGRRWGSRRRGGSGNWARYIKEEKIVLKINK